MRLIYTANARIPSEKAHPYQIVQMCEAFASAGADVTLITPTRQNEAGLETDDIWGYYGVERNFTVERLASPDLHPLAQRVPHRLSRLVDRLAAMLIRLTYNTALMRRLARERDAVVYSRHTLALALFSTLWPRRARRAFYEAHTAPATSSGRRLRRWLVKRIGGVVCVTGQLAERHIALGAPPERVMVAHDGYRRARFEIDGSRADWRQRLGWPSDAFIVGYAGRFVSGLEGMDKGIATLTEAAIRLTADEGAPPVRLALVGGPETFLERIREQVAQAGLPADFMLTPGMVPAEDVPGYLRAFDVCTIASPWTDFFAYYTSPLKLFEYMASGSALVATDLPSTAEVVQNGQNGLLVPPSDAEALAGALRRLRDDPALRERLAAQALIDVQAYSWEARAHRILEFIAGLTADDQPTAGVTA